MTYAQQFKVIKDTTDYVLKEVNSDYYSTHGFEASNDFVKDSTVNYKYLGIVKIPLDNGKFVAFNDTFTYEVRQWISYFYEGYSAALNCYLIKQGGTDRDHWFLVNKSSGTKEFISDKPNYSPQKIVDGYCVGYNEKASLGSIKFASFKTGNSTLITVNNKSPYGLKWIDDKSFLFETDCMNKKHFPVKECGFYLVEIKQ